MANNTGVRENSSALSLWTLTDGKAGDVVQCGAIAGGLSGNVQHRVISPRAPWSWMSPWGPIDPKDRRSSPVSALARPFPDLVIASGRRAVPYACAVKKMSAGVSKIMILKDPRLRREMFDLIWAPEHDRLVGDNVFSTLTSPHGLEAKLAELRSRDGRASALPGGPMLGVVLGGPTGTVDFDAEFARMLAVQVDEAGGTFKSIFAAPSRRTPKKFINVFKEYNFKSPIEFLDADGDGYLRVLAHASAIIVTGDSHNMVSEALATGASVYVARPPGLPEKMQSFLARLEADGAARTFAGDASLYYCDPIDSTKTVVNEVKRRLLGGR